MGKGKGQGGCGATMELDLSLPKGIVPLEQALPGITAAVSDIADALKAGQKVAVFCDYDPDGTCGAAIMSLALDKFKQQTIFGFASAADGTGLSEQFVRDADSQGASTLITVDLGSSQPAVLDLARSLGIKVIVTDHHAPHPEADPDHHLNPQLHGPSQSSGAVVAWKLALALEEQLYGAPRPKVLSEGAFLAAFGARADMMDIKETENAAIDSMGGQAAPPGLQALAERLSVKSLSASNQSKLAALLNLPKRSALAKASDAALILSASSKSQATSAIDRLLAVREACSEASRCFGSQAAQQMSDQSSSRVASAVIDLPDCHLYAGYAGIVAMRMSGAAARPAVIFVPLDQQSSRYKYSVRWTGKRENLGDGLLESIDALGKIASRSGGSPPGGHPQAMGGICGSGEIEEVKSALEDWAKGRGLQELDFQSTKETK